ncbi:MAG: OmpA family protein [Bradymonadales bacterium]|nr:OmpA family protein [Bradymonadales bacterium]
MARHNLLPILSALFLFSTASATPLLAQPSREETAPAENSSPGVEQPGEDDAGAPEEASTPQEGSPQEETAAGTGEGTGAGTTVAPETGAQEAETDAAEALETGAQEAETDAAEALETGAQEAETDAAEALETGAQEGTATGSGQEAAASAEEVTAAGLEEGPSDEEIDPTLGSATSCSISPDCPPGEVCREGQCQAACQDRVLPVLYSDFDSTYISPHQVPVLDQVLLCLEAWPDDRIRVEGHTDPRGSTEYNYAVSQRTAREVRRYLESQGVDPDRIDVIGYGESRPVCNQSTEQCWARCRRVELVWR